MNNKIHSDIQGNSFCLKQVIKHSKITEWTRCISHKFLKIYCRNILSNAYIPNLKIDLEAEVRTVLYTYIKLNVTRTV